MSHRTMTDATVPLDEQPGGELDELLNAAISEPAPVRTPITGVVVGTLIALTDGGRALVNYPGQPGTAALPAETMVELHGVHVGRRLAMMFEDGNPHRPLILGCLKDRAEHAPAATIGQIDVDADGERFTIAAARELVLRCGHASITLTCDGKILIQGTYVSNRSSGIMRIKGGSVQIN